MSWRPLQCGIWLLVFCWTGSVWGEPRSIQAFVEAREQWTKTIGATWNLEGRYAILGKNDLRFMNCTLPFVFGPDVQRPPGRFTNLEVSGELQRRDGKLIFLISSIRALPSDMQRLIVERAAIDNDDVDKWYDLAQWAKQRAEFYADPALQEAAQELLQHGLETEFRNLNPADREGLVSIVRKARGFKMDPLLIENFLHNGYWDRYLFLRDKEPASSSDQYSNLLVSIANDLNGARKSLSSYDPQLAKAYLEKPTSTYEVATTTERDLLERYFYLHVVSANILRQADESGRNAFQITEQLQKEAPERKDLIEQYTLLGLRYESDRIAVKTRKEMLELAKRYEDRKQLDLARETKQTWLKAREDLYRSDGARGLVDLAEEWIQLLDDRNAAARYYIEAWKLNSQYPLAASWLEENGYGLFNGEWVPSELMPVSQDSAIEKAIREGRIEKGMTTAQVKTAMGVAPDSIVRFATNGKVTELWVYESARTTIRFVWTLGSQHSIVESMATLVDPAR